MVAAVLVLLVIAVLFGLGFVVKALLWVALALLVVWALGWAVGAGAAAGSRRRWYYW
ncbi:MAG TPA: hydrophobic protein [Actinomycetota bacterium]|nr:hydrophobic protein [Actinomycetota bacterium]